MVQQILNYDAELGDPFADGSLIAHFRALLKHKNTLLKEKSLKTHLLLLSFPPFKFILKLAPSFFFQVLLKINIKYELLSSLFAFSNHNTLL